MDERAAAGAVVFELAEACWMPIALHLWFLHTLLAMQLAATFKHS